MKRVSEAMKGRVMVVATVPCGLLGVVCMAALLMGLLFEWRHSVDVAVTTVCLMFLWGLLGLCVFTVMEYWPQRD